MQLSKRSVIILLAATGIMFLVILFLAFKAFQKDANLQVYKVKAEMLQEALIELKEENKVLEQESKAIDSALAVYVSERSDALIDLDKTNRQPIIIKHYEDKITDIKRYGSDDLYRYFSDLR